MAVLLVDPDDPALNIRAAIIAAASGDMILLDPNDTYNLVGVIDDDRVGPGMAIGPDQIGRTSNPAFINQANEVVAFNRQLTDPEGNNYKASPSSGRPVLGERWRHRLPAGQLGHLEGQKLGTAIGSQLYGQLSSLWS
jgi:hypothetical protein